MKPKLHIVHGWAYSLDKWDKLIANLEEDGIEVCMLRVPGLTAPSDKVWDMDGYVDWLEDQLKDEGNDVILLGHSNGGRIALNYNMRGNSKIKHLLLLSSAGVWTDPGRQDFKRKVLQIGAKILKPLASLPGLKKVLYRLVGASDYNNAPTNMKQTLVNMINSDKQLDLAASTMPVNLIWGGHDSQTPIAQAQKLKAELPNVIGYQVIPDARHAPYATHPDQLSKLIIDALGGSKS